MDVLCPAASGGGLSVSSGTRFGSGSSSDASFSSISVGGLVVPGYWCGSLRNDNVRGDEAEAQAEEEGYREDGVP